jgi:hypothetical protein
VSSMSEQDVAPKATTTPIAQIIILLICFIILKYYIVSAGFRTLGPEPY